MDDYDDIDDQYGYGYYDSDDYEDEDSDYMYDFEDDEEYGDDYCYYCWSQGFDSCMGEMPEFLSTLGLSPEVRSLDNICQFDVYWMVKHVINILEVIVTEGKHFQEEEDSQFECLTVAKDISKIINVGKKIEERVKSTLQISLKKLLKLPDIAVIKILDFLLDQSVSDSVKFEEQDVNERVKRILLNVYDYFCKSFCEVVNHIRERMVCNNSCKCVILLLLLEGMETIQLSKLDDEAGNDWKEYFGIEEETVDDIWEDEELANCFRELFVEHIS